MVMHGYRVVSAALLPITIAPFAAGSLSPILDGTFIGLLLIHSYVGFQYRSPPPLSFPVPLPPRPR